VKNRREHRLPEIYADRIREIINFEAKNTGTSSISFIEEIHCNGQNITPAKNLPKSICVRRNGNVPVGLLW